MAEDKQFTADYHTPEIRSLTNAVQVTIQDGTEWEDVVVEFPLGHLRRPESVPMVYEKAKRNLSLKLAPEKVDAVLSPAQNDEKLLETPVTISLIYLPFSLVHCTNKKHGLRYLLHGQMEHLLATLTVLSNAECVKWTASCLPVSVVQRSQGRRHPTGSHFRRSGLHAEGSTESRRLLESIGGSRGRTPGAS